MMNKLGKHKAYIIGGAVWAAAIASIIIIAEIKNPRNSNLDINVDLEQEMVSKIFKGLTEEDKIRVNYYENGFIKLEDGQYHLIGNTRDGDEPKLLKNGLLAIKRIPLLNEDDPVLAERR